MFKTIVVALDGSEGSRAAIPLTIELAPARARATRWWPRWRSAPPAGSSWSTRCGSPWLLGPLNVTRRDLGSGQRGDIERLAEAVRVRRLSAAR